MGVGRGEETARVIEDGEKEKLMVRTERRKQDIKGEGHTCTERDCH